MINLKHIIEQIKLNLYLFTNHVIFYYNTLSKMVGFLYHKRVPQTSKKISEFKLKKN
jgi:hypothetical protein